MNQMKATNENESKRSCSQLLLLIAIGGSPGANKESRNYD